MKKTTHNLKGCLCPKGSDVRFCLANSLTNQEPWEKEFDKTFGKGKTKTDNGLYSMAGWSDDLVKAFISKLLQQERDESLRFKGKMKREWYQKGYSNALKEHKKALEDLEIEHQKEMERTVKEEKEATAKEFGECEKCFGKGYASYFSGYRIAADFIGDKDFEGPKKVSMVFCTCNRGKQLKELLKEHK